MLSAAGPRLLTTYVRLQEILMQLDKQDRQQKLEETFQSVCEDYRRILAMTKI